MMKHIVALSGGKDSTALALRLAEIEPQEYHYVCTPTGNELPEMMAHWENLESLLGKPVERITTHSLPYLIAKQKALPNWRMRWCTRMIKIEPFEQYVAANIPCTVYVGIRADETDREGVDYEKMGGVIRRFPLVEWGWDINKVISYLKERNVIIPKRTDCAACFFQTLGEWHDLWKSHPEYYSQAEAWEQYTGHTLRSEQRDSHPAALSELRKEFENGYTPQQRTMKDRKIMCSVCAR